jgi:hypothetical protein
MKYKTNNLQSSLIPEMLQVILPIVAIGLTLIGYSVSPRDENGNSLLLSPRSEQVASYQRQVRTWIYELSGIKDGLDALLTSSSGDLLSLDSQVNQYYGQLIHLQDEVDRTQAPATLAGLHDEVVAAVNAYAVAATSTAIWVSAPSDTNHTQATNDLQKASGLLDLIYQNPWVQQ